MLCQPTELNVRDGNIDTYSSKQLIKCLDSNVNHWSDLIARLSKCDKLQNLCPFILFSLCALFPMTGTHINLEFTVDEVGLSTHIGTGIAL
jgi:hypothetical protein